VRKLTAVPSLTFALLLGSTGVSWGDEITLDCKYDITIWLGVNLPGSEHRQDDGVDNISLRINLEEGTLTQGKLRKINFSRDGDIISYHLVSDQNLKYRTDYFYELNSINGRLEIKERAKISPPENYLDTDEEGYSTSKRYYFNCSKVDSLF